MNRNDAAKDTAQKLYGPTVQYADGKVVPGQLIDVERVLAQFKRLEVDARSAFLCIIAHDLTVAVRSVVFDAPVTQAGIDRVKWINESLHQLTSCVNPHKRWSADDEAMLIRGIIESSFEHDFDGWVGRALAVAAENAIGTEKSVKSSDAGAIYKRDPRWKNLPS
jgi:hypothetical protein